MNFCIITENGTNKWKDKNSHPYTDEKKEKSTTHNFVSASSGGCEF